MLPTMRWLLATGTLLLVAPLLLGQAGENDEMVANPLYKYWANFKPGSTSVRSEKTVYHGASKPFVPDGVDMKVVRYKLLSVSPEKVVVQMIVTERDFLGYIEAAPTKMAYPAKIKKSYLQAALHNVDAKPGEDTIKLKDQTIACKTLEGVEKKGGETVEHKVWLSDEVPGGIIRRTSISRQDGKAVAETTISLKSFKKAE